ncbi:DUF4922 domain-containing protein [Mangrovibacterium sp.]|uniref:DUF4922 domain-containing protein n=1 Tax=Mangrovibacterium sp. TaxID=1961364 RepID=UPI0035692495
MNFQTNIHELIRQQKSEWKLAGTNYNALAKIEKRSFNFDDFQIIAQFNPERIRSTGARTDHSAISQRPCFLCKKNRPDEQVGINFRGHYEILINPFPIFDQHLTIPGYDHEPQQLSGRLADMLDLAEELTDFTLFYNGPKCGASAPDHFHFQAGQRKKMPIELEMARQAVKADVLIDRPSIRILAIGNSYLRKVIFFQSKSKAELSATVEQVIKLMESESPAEEPMMNVLANFEAGSWQVLLFPREKQRPRQYFLTDENQILMSPASVEMGGLVVLPRAEDFAKLSNEDLSDIYRQVTLNDTAFETLRNKIRHQFGRQ